MGIIVNIVLVLIIILIYYNYDLLKFKESNNDELINYSFKELNRFKQYDGAWYGSRNQISNT